MNSSIPAETSSKCLECGADLTSAELQGLCARCLLKLGLASQFGDPSIVGAGLKTFVPPPMFPFDFGDYHVTRLLGRGGMGAVYEATHGPTGRRLALKVLGHTIDSPEMRKRFLREGRLAAAVNHPNSVYIYGTEEIENVPVIAMELVSGGTLKDELKKRGPLPPKEAVDHVLKMIAGLEAALGQGILHRDIKPANCFVATGGDVKIGDFGLSVSTLAREDSQLTASGVMLGTPSFAPPEQLRGDELDVRADIYSVGATLYSLLSGRAPFSGDNAVQVVAAVLDKVPESLASVRSDLPPGLADVVSRCLAKRPQDRFADYAGLRDALLPFSSQVPEAAPPSLRFIAGLLDEILISVPWLLTTILSGRHLDEVWLSKRSFASAFPIFGQVLIHFAYYWLGEGRWGTTIGKSLCGLRVSPVNAAGAPGLRLALIRSLIYVSCWYFGMLVTFLTTEATTYAELLKEDHTFFADYAWIVFALLFVTIRRKNGFAAMHDLLSGTRVVMRQRAGARPPLGAPAVEQRPAKAEKVGPFLLGDALPIQGWSAASDEVLRRSIWIRRVPAGAPAIDEPRRELGRIGRLRWIAGVRSETEGWDAFEAPSGRALLDLPAKSAAWASVRYWLHDIVMEIDAATKDGTLPSAIGLANVWITADGRAVLLDEPITRNGDEGESFVVTDPLGLQRFLSAICDRILDPTTLTVSAREFIKRLVEGTMDRITFVAGNLESLLTKPATISFRRRFASLILAPGLATILAMTIAFAAAHTMLRDERKLNSRFPEAVGLGTTLELYTHASDDAAVATSSDPGAKQFPDVIGDYVNGKYGELIRSDRFEEVRDEIGTAKHALARKLVEGRTTSPEAYAAAAKQVEPAVKMARGIVLVFLGPAMFFGIIFFQGCVHFAGVLFAGVVPGLRLFRMAVVNRQGLPVGRLHLLARSIVSWLPLIPSLFGLVVYGDFHELVGESLRLSEIAMAIVGPSLFLAGMIVAAVRRNGGIADMIVRTRIVPL